jgi:hypothetical protein
MPFAENLLTGSNWPLKKPQEPFMGVIFQASYALPGADEPLTNARIAHSGNWFSGTVTASTTAAGFFASGPDNSLTYETWKPTAIPATWENDLGSAVLVNYCCIAAHTLGTNGCTITIQYWDGSAWVDRTPATLIADNMPIFCIFAGTTAQRWRVNITAGAGNPSIGVIKFGAALQMQQPFYGGHTPLALAVQVILRSNQSETGENLGRTKQRVMFGTSFSWQHLKADWVRTNWPPFQRAMAADAFFIAWRPIDYSEVGFCQVDQIPAPSNMGVKDYMSVDMSVRALGYD